jgi:ribonuclease III
VERSDDAATATGGEGACGARALRIAHTFDDPRLLEEALTHRSYQNEHPEARAHNERLEFLGDAVLGMIVAEALMRLAPAASEGQLTQRRAALVNERTLAGIARELGLGELLRLGRGEEKNNGREKPSILADAVEAVVGAVYLDGGLDAARRAVRDLLGEALDDAASGAVGADVKTALQERLQAGGGGTPSYHVVATSGPEHRKEFEVEIVLNEAVIARGRGRSKKEAEKDAARNALKGRAADGGEE